MPTLLTLAEFKYPNAHIEVISEDSRQLLRVMKEKFPNAHFHCTKRGQGKEQVLVLEVVGAGDFQRINMSYFAEGFMASANLWER